MDAVKLILKILEGKKIQNRLKIRPESVYTKVDFKQVNNAPIFLLSSRSLRIFSNYTISVLYDLVAD